MATKTIKVPDIGDFDEVDVIEVLVSEGDSIEAEQSLITLESDKATMEVPASESGKVGKLLVKVGDKVAEGMDILELETGDSEDAGEAPREPAPDANAAEDKPAPAPEPAETGGGSQTVKVPDIGDFDEVDVIEVLVAEGDQVEAEQSLITLESDKATMEVPAPAAGTVQALHIKVGDKVAEGTAILELTGAAGGAKKTAPEKPASGEEPAPAKADDAGSDRAADKPRDHQLYQLEADPGPVPVQAIDSEGHRLAHASPGVRRYARELGVDLSGLKGTGRKGRIVKEDVQQFVKQAVKQAGSGAAAAAPAAGGGMGIPPIPEVDFSKFGETEEKPLSRIKQKSGPHLHRSWLNVPHVTQFEEADITALEDFRKAEKAAAEKAGVKLTPLAFLVKAAAAALVEFPDFNSSLKPDGSALILKRYINVGVAVDTPNGLVVPVVKDAHQKGVYAIARDLGEISSKARDGKLGPGDMQGGTFSISSLGGIGGTAFTPIVNAPEVAILGVSRSEMKPKWNGSEFEPRLMLPLSLSYDHRVIDGAAAARFTTYLSGLLADLRRLVL